ncbi:MAG: Coenzyme F420 hydrogenase/dehydrogenase, beta subunit C-terminal domain [Actinomycetota bacterium]|nr:Coenzyme F420 hydrogenase/dehydrogenase, beta subunit C-terminal domain [Actinomycetota bacterium]
MLLGQEKAGDEWRVRWLGFSLNQTKVGEGDLDVWDDPEMASARLAVEVGIAVRDRWPDAFPAVHRELFAARHDHGLDIRERSVVAGGAETLALVGMSCQSSVPPVMTVRKAGKPARRFVLNIGLLCSKTFDDAIFEELFEAKYGLRKQDMVKMNIKGVFQIWMRDGSYHEVPLKECHAWTREGCKLCPDFAAEHADISTGGIGAFNDWTLTIVRTDLGREIIVKMLQDGTIEGRPGDDDPGAIALLRKLSAKSRKRWPETAVPAPRLLPAPAPKPAAVT